MDDAGRVERARDHSKDKQQHLTDSQPEVPTATASAADAGQLVLTHISAPAVECPSNFSPVVGNIYRSSFPRPDHFPFLAKLGLKSVLVLIPEPYPDENMKFLEDNNIQFFQVGMSGNKEPFVHVSHETITKALEVVLNPANHPLLIHCNRGKHRTGCLVGCLRRLQDWSLTMIFDEYRRFAYPKTRPLDQQMIELYDDTEIYERAVENNWLPLNWT